jgi:AcrR family transcriptional regulator
VGEALLDAAEALLVEGGPDAVSVRGAAIAAATTTRAVYSRFGSKAGLLEALAVRGYLVLAGLVNGVTPTDDPAADLVEAGVSGFRPFAIGRPHLFRLTFERALPASTTDPDVRAALVASYDALAGWITRAQDAGVVDPALPVAEVGFVVHASCQGLASNELARRPPPDGVGLWANTRDLDAEQLWRRGLGALVAGLAPPAA